MSLETGDSIEQMQNWKAPTSSEIRSDWEQQLQTSRERVGQIREALPALEQAFKDNLDTMISVKTTDQGQSYEVSSASNRMNPELLQKLQEFIDQTGGAVVKDKKNGIEGTYKMSVIFSEKGMEQTTPRALFAKVRTELGKSVN